MGERKLVEGGGADDEDDEDDEEEEEEEDEENEKLRTRPDPFLPPQNKLISSQNPTPFL